MVGSWFGNAQTGEAKRDAAASLLNLARNRTLAWSADASGQSGRWRQPAEAPGVLNQEVAPILEPEVPAGGIESRLLACLRRFVAPACNPVANWAMQQKSKRRKRQ